MAERAARPQRQDREGTGGQEVLNRPALVVALVRDGGDDAGLRIGPGDPADAGEVAQPGAAAVRGDEKRRLAGLAAADADADRARTVRETLDPRRFEDDAGPAAGRDEGGREIASLDHVGEGLARLDFAGEAEEDRPDRVLEARIGDDHVEDRLRRRGDALPDAERLEHPPRRGRDGVGAGVALRIAAQGRIGHRHLNAVAERPLQRQGQRQPGKAAAGDDDAGRYGRRRGHGLSGVERGLAGWLDLAVNIGCAGTREAVEFGPDYRQGEVPPLHLPAPHAP